MKSKAVAFITFAIVLAFTFLIPLSAHRGMTDENGGHWDNSTGEYHYHCGGNPAHDHYGGVCPYDRIPADSPNYSDDYGNGTSVTRKEEPMDGWIIALIIIGGIIAIGVLFTLVEKVRESAGIPPRWQLLGEIEKIKKESERLAKEKVELQNKNAELCNKQKVLETDNAELLKNLKKQKEITFDLQEESRKLRKENGLLLEQIDGSGAQTNNIDIEKLKNQLEKKEQRIDILETKNRELELQYGEFREASIKGFKAEAWKTFFRKAEKVLKSKYDFDRFFESAESGRLDSALAETVRMNSIEFYAEFEPHSDPTADIYQTTLNGCTCKDYKFSKKKNPCKHMLYLAYSIGALQLNADKFEKTKGRLVKAVRSNSLKNKVLIRKNKKLIGSN